MQIEIDKAISIVDNTCEYVADRYPEWQEAVDLVSAYIHYEFKKLKEDK